ncbi:MAG TPA: hypothetical protein VF303_04460 [Candidatus Nanoarchaeia archaeon]
MKRLEFDENDKLADALKAIASETDKELEIFVFPGSDILKLPANLEVINLQAKSLGKKVVIKGDFEKKPLEVVAKKEKDENLGFVEGKDVAGQEPTAKPIGLPEEKKRRFPFPKLPSPAFLKGRRRLYLIAGFLAFIIIAGLGLLWFVPRAHVKLITKAQFKEAELSLVAGASIEEADTDQGAIPLKTLKTTQEDVLEAKATGTKTVGTLAKGRVKIVNRDTASAKTFFKGTTITPVSGSKVTFSLDKSATISAAPAGCEADCPSTGVDVTAKVIGTSGNLAAGTVFRVGSANVNLVFAKSETNFTGGSSRNLTIISASDQKKAKEKLLAKLARKAREELEKENQDLVVPEGGLEPEILNEVYSKNVGEEASEFRLSLQVEFTAKAFSEEDLKDLLIESIADSVPDDFKIDRGTSTVEAEILEKDGDNLEILGKIKASLVPEIDIEETKKRIAGKDFSTTDRYLKSLNSISGFEIKISPSFFRIAGFMPFLKSRIKIELIQEE